MCWRKYTKKDIKDIVIFLIPALLILTVFLLATVGCNSIKQVPIQTIEKTIYRDSLVYIKDSIKVQVPYEVVKEVVPDIDTSYIKTSYAESIAYLDTTTHKLHHTLTQRGEIKTEIDTAVNVTIIEKTVEKEVPIPVEVIKYKRDALFWVLVGWAIICLLLIGLKFFIKK